MKKFEDFKLERYFAAHEFSAKHLLSCSDAESIRLRELLDFEPGSREALEERWLGYSDSQGLPELRREIAGLYASISPDQVLAHTGAQEPILNLFMSVLSPGDHVITHFPGYQSGFSIPRALGCELSPWSARESNEWLLDLDELRGLIRPETKLVVLNCPHNPTGRIMPKSDFAELIALLRERGILLLSDEVYRGLELDDADRLPTGADAYENGISLGVMSKAYGLAGLRVGWVATRNPEVLHAMAKQKDYTTICNPGITEWLAALALRNGEKLLTRNREILGANIRSFESFLARRGDLFDWVPPQGGTMGFAWRRDGKSMEPLARKLLTERELMLISGKYFDTDEKFFRLGLGRRNFPEVLASFEAGIGL